MRRPVRWWIPYEGRLRDAPGVTFENISMDAEWLQGEHSTKIHDQREISTARNQLQVSRTAGVILLMYGNS